MFNQNSQFLHRLTSLRKAFLSMISIVKPNKDLTKTLNNFVYQNVSFSFLILIYKGKYITELKTIQLCMLAM